MIETEPERRRRRKLGIATADPAHCITAKGYGQDHASGADMPEHRVGAHSNDERKKEEAANEGQRHAVRDRHGQEIARGRKGHHRRKQHQPECGGNHVRHLPKTSIVTSIVFSARPILIRVSCGSVSVSNVEAPATSIAAGASLPVRWALIGAFSYFTAAATARKVASRLVP